MVVEHMFQHILGAPMYISKIYSLMTGKRISQSCTNLDLSHLENVSPCAYSNILNAMGLDPDSEILESSFSHRAIVLICTIVKVLAVAAKERTECFLSSTATFESLTAWADAMQNPLMNEAGRSSSQTRVGNGGAGHGRRVSGTRDKVEDVKIKELKGEIVINGKSFLAHVRDQFTTSRPLVLS